MSAKNWIIAQTVAGLLGVVVPIASAMAGETEDLIHSAIEIRRRGDDTAALPLLRRAYSTDPGTRAAAQLGLCEHAVGLWVDAETHLMEALRAERDPWILKYRAVLEDDLEVIRSHLALVEIGGTPDGARVSVDGREIGRLPLTRPVRVAAGLVEIAISAPGLPIARREIRIEGGQTSRVEISAVSIGDTVTKPIEPNVTSAMRPSEVRQTVWRPRFKWIAWGTAVLAVGVGTYGAFENLHLVHVFENGGCWVSDQGRAVDSSGMPSQPCETKKSDYEFASRLAIASFAAAGVLGAAGLVLWLTEPDGQHLRAVSAACGPEIDGHLAVSYGCRFRF